MSGGSIYIDPDSVSSVSSQIGITAEQLDSLRRSIVPQVNEVISMSYPSIQEMPDVAYPLNTTQDNIEAFNYRAQLLVEDLRTTSLKLNQIAEAGRTMNEILLRQTTMFGVVNQAENVLAGSANSIGNIELWLQQFTGYIGTETGIATWLIDTLSKGKGLVGLSDFNKLKALSKWMDTREGKSLLGGFGFLTDFIGNGQYDVKSFFSDAIGAGIGAAITHTPIGGIVVASFGAISLVGAGLGSLQGLLANRYANNPQLQQALESTANGLTEAAQHANPQKVFDDVGSTAIDTGAAMFGFGSWASAGKDLRGTLNDTASTVYSVPQFVADTGFMVQQDSNLGINALVQNSSLPQSWKSVYQANTINDIKITGQFANFVNSVPTRAGKLTDAAQNIIATGSQQFYNQEVVVQ